MALVSPSLRENDSLGRSSLLAPGLPALIFLLLNKLLAHKIFMSLLSKPQEVARVWLFNMSIVH